MLKAIKEKTEEVRASSYTDIITLGTRGRKDIIAFVQRTLKS